MKEKETIIIDPQRIEAPPEKVKLMYQAVSELLREGREIGELKVQEITGRAGIGKGTAYEYFSSKEALVAHALAYEYSRKIAELARIAFEPERFQQRFYVILDWIETNREYHQFLSASVRDLFGYARCPEQQEPDDFSRRGTAYFYRKISELMEYGYAQGIYTEQNPAKRVLAFMSACMEYAFAASGRDKHLLMGLEKEELREFIYRSMLAALRM